jgi:hypothetical protein
LLQVPVPERQHQAWSSSTEAAAMAWRSSPGAAPGCLH